MIKRKFADSPNWTRIINKGFKMTNIDNQDFKGHVSAILLAKVKQPLIKNMFGKDYCLADDGYIWLQQLPVEENFCITTMFNNKQEIVQWYIDIIKAQGITEKGIPYFDDLFLDVVVVPEGQVLLLDEDELEEALNNNEITKQEYNMAYEEANKIINEVATNINRLTELSKEHFKALISEENS